MNHVYPVFHKAFRRTLISDPEIDSSQKISTENPGNVAKTGQDVSQFVHRITEIIRDENSTFSMEHSLGEAGLTFDSDTVDKILKRCFKARDAAIRFFYWVKLQPGFQHTAQTYNTMLYIAGEAKEFDLIKRLLDEMNSEECPKDIKTWTILVSHYGKAKQLGEALKTFKEMKKSGFDPDETVYGSMVLSLCNARKSELAAEFYKEMALSGMKLDSHGYKLLMTCLGEAGDIFGVRSVGNDMLKIAGMPKCAVHSSMMQSLSISGRFGDAIKLVNEIRGENSSLEEYQVLFKGLCRACRMNNALELLGVICKHEGAIDRDVYEILINGYLRIGEISVACVLLNSMKKLGFLPSVSTYTDIVQHLFRMNAYEEGCRLYEEMKESGLEPDVVAMTALVAGHVCHSQFSKAKEAFDNMKERGIKPTWKAYSIYIKELCKINEPEQAFELLKEMKSFKMNAGQETCQIVISLLEKAGKLEKVQLVKQMSNAFALQNQEPDLADVHISQELFCEETKTHSSNSGLESLDNEPLLPLMNELELGHPSQKTYSDQDLQDACRILLSFSDWSVLQEGLEKSTIKFTPHLVHEIMRKCQIHGNSTLRFFSWVGRIPGYHHTTETYNLAIKISGSAKDFKHMKSLYLEMRRKGCLITADTWTIMLAQYGRVGLTNMALRRFKAMKFKKYNPDRNTYKYMIMFLCGKKGRKVEEAILIFKEMLGVGFSPDQETLEIYLTCLCEVGKLSDARDCVDSLSKVSFTDQFRYSVLVKALCRAGKLDEALALSKELGTLDQYIYGSLVHGLLRAGRVDEALKMVGKMTLDGFSPTVHVYTSFLVHYFKEKQMEKALEIFRKMREDGCEPSIITYSALIRGYMNQGLAIDAWNTFWLMKLKGPFPDFETYSMFISCLCRDGRSEEALQLIYDMMEDGIIPSTLNFRTVYYGLNREGKHDLAHTVLQAKWALMKRRKFST
ncbi:putative pentatricopeptide repeat-containing protein At5g06400, mitochondrial [Amborella trichopoda]|uniref:Pentacotripeptide-repeat region of PRORP domain-containing protein n=1 Tax=Amborella trichopoda TaxID=13333 RepID=W1NE55_AMBTC|nr:putative pentatricopeptide repeat-containing protein At5g06400, mitochondrial [Amborella trichopoda]ERM93661.1 hypothetical protein AMTR_s00004p00162290 [Amborella trichopoda]|eukprot:XP_006826424.1 putative pentatricopeptide repeat-containing protein At5g06400, mitochondrial [Amborella trichopoda]